MTATSTCKPSGKGCDVTGTGNDHTGSPQGWDACCILSLLTTGASSVGDLSLNFGHATLPDAIILVLACLRHSFHIEFGVAPKPCSWGQTRLASIGCTHGCFNVGSRQFPLLWCQRSL